MALTHITCPSCGYMPRVFSESVDYKIARSRSQDYYKDRNMYDFFIVNGEHDCNPLTRNTEYEKANADFDIAYHRYVMSLPMTEVMDRYRPIYGNSESWYQLGNRIPFNPTTLIETCVLIDLNNGFECCEFIDDFHKHMKDIS